MPGREMERLGGKLLGSDDRGGDINASALTSSEVYDLAATLRQEFERLIVTYGPDPIATLIPQVVYVLELLEHLAEEYQKQATEKEELKYLVERLRADKEIRIAEKEKYEKVRYL